MSFIKGDYIFIHIPKTGGVSVKHVLNNSKQSGHETLYQISKDGKDLFGTKYSDKQKIISCCRDPLKRFVSAYHYCKVMHSEHIPLPKNIHELIEQLPYRSDILGWVHFRPMVEFLWMPKMVEVDMIRFESFDKDFYSIFGQKIGKVNGTKYKTPILTTGERNIIQDVYKEDYLNFGY